MKTIRIGTGAGFSGDRVEPALDLAKHGDIDYLVFECLAERTIALAQQAKMRDPNAGFDPLLERRMRAVLPVCHEKSIRVISNMGAANPVAAAKKTVAIARELGLTGLKVAAVLGDDVLDILSPDDFRITETASSLRDFNKQVVSANAYLGAGGIVDALNAGADVILTGRAADPAMFLAPQIFEFGWKMDDWSLLGRGTLVGHLLECGGQITGGYFADPGIKDVPDLARLGFPIAEVSADGNAVITKLEGTGGCVTTATCKEQLLYEVHDPKKYIQPDVVADFSNVCIEEIGPDRVAISGGDGAPRTGSLKVSIGYIDSCIGEGQISYAGPGAVARGQLALDILDQRMDLAGITCQEKRGELIGVNSIISNADMTSAEPNEVRLRFVVRTDDLATATRIGEEVESLYLNGPAGGGGVTKNAREIVAIVSGLLPEHQVQTHFEMMEA
ncbi:ABC transporter substrate-binding protein [Thalassospira profundimaris]|uniref:ABC transporter substrate-binding protein n=1 Tax=Thalassospira profundimaris TaxID=502049 RepID=A0A367W238_9PROT|nr:acyclic terpene utilization AtuA family protein [Thalassospira profundimaris]RCK33847.1 ABC transporter substrate-binding protein [Thalassospira profundimaris]